ncbi:MAG: serine/threonine-protein phosphatase [Planctomycetales bacterium]|nr:serine/threonine-protein phosphatase [Planctomycetales bacterium]
MSGSMDCCGLTDVGRKRKNNEDQFLIADVSKSMRVHQTSLALDHQTRLFGDTKGKLLLVADGMGGHEAGERASQVVIDGIVDHTLNRLSWFMFNDCLTDDEFEEQLKQGLVECQRRIDREVEAIPSRRGMGSTLTLCYIVWPRMFLVHVGDSRCYLLRGGVLQQLTRDHTLAELSEAIRRKAEDTGEGLDDMPDESLGPMAHVLWNAIGGAEQDPHPDAQALNLEIGDTLLLCTDGLNKHLSKRQITEILSLPIKTDEKCQVLVEAANDAGGTDNITVVISSFTKDTESLEANAEIELPLNDALPNTDEFFEPIPS